MKKPRPNPYVAALLVASFVAAACDAPVIPPAAADQVDTACDRAVDSLRYYKGKGMSCQASKERVAKEEPLCNLTFICPGPRDGGAE